MPLVFKGDVRLSKIDKKLTIFGFIFFNFIIMGRIKEVVIYLTYYLNGVAVPRSTGVRIHFSDWDDVKGRVRLKNPNAGRLNDRLKECRDKIDA